MSFSKRLLFLALVAGGLIYAIKVTLGINSWNSTFNDIVTKTTGQGYYHPAEREALGVRSKKDILYNQDDKNLYLIYGNVKLTIPKKEITDEIKSKFALLGLPITYNEKGDLVISTISKSHGK